MFPTIWSKLLNNFKRAPAISGNGGSEPKFRSELHHEDPRFPWGFRIEVTNCSHKTLHVLSVRISGPKGIAYVEALDPSMSILDAVLEAILHQRNIFEFDLSRHPNADLPGTSFARPIAALTAEFRAFRRTAVPLRGRSVGVKLEISWLFADDVSPKLEVLFLDVPVDDSFGIQVDQTAIANLFLH